MANKPHFLGEMVANSTELPIPFWGLAFLLGTASSAVDLAAWMIGRQATFGTQLALPCLSILFAQVAIFLCTWRLIDRRPTIAAALRFMLALVASFLPFILLIAIAKLFPDPGDPAALTLLIGCAILGFLTVAFLPAWIVAQGLSPRPVSPLRGVAATRGHRWGLLGFIFLLGGTDQLLPDIGTARTTLDATLIAGGFALLMMFIIVFSSTLYATAWQFARHNDPGFGGSLERADT